MRMKGVKNEVSLVVEGKERWPLQQCFLLGNNRIPKYEMEKTMKIWTKEKMSSKFFKR